MTRKVPVKETQHSAKEPRKGSSQKLTAEREEQNPPSDITTYTYKSSVVKKSVKGDRCRLHRVTATELEGGLSLLQLPRYTQNKSPPTQDSTQRNTNIPAPLIKSHGSPIMHHSAPPHPPQIQKQTHKQSAVYCTVGPLKGETHIYIHISKKEKCFSSSCNIKKCRNGQNPPDLGLSVHYNNSFRVCLQRPEA